MRQAFALLGLLTFLVSAGAYFAFQQKDTPPTDTTESIGNVMALTLTSPAFENDRLIPSKYSCDGDNVSPPLHIDGVPEGTESLVLLMDDPDIPVSVKQTRGIESFDHWVVYNIPPTTTVIGEGSIEGSQGVNTRGTEGYTGPCPPDKEHRYFFRLYALNGTLNFTQSPTLREVEEAAQSMMIESATLIGRYERARE